jgi:hypothetical protein
MMYAGGGDQGKVHIPSYYPQSTNAKRIDKVFEKKDQN